MRCYCCDALPTRQYRGEYLCAECRSVVQSTIKEDNDDSADTTKLGGDVWIVHAGWDEGNHPPVTLPKMKERKKDD